MTRRKRLLLLVTTGLVLTAAMWTWRRYWLDVPIGSGPAGPAVPRELFAQPWTDRPVHLVGIGDSVTDGFGAQAGLGYFDRLARNPPNEYPDMGGLSLAAVFPRLEKIKLARSSTTSDEHLDRQVAAMKPASAETLGVIVMTTGGNDLIHDYGRSPPRENAMFGATLAQAAPWIERFEQRLGEMVRKVAAAYPGGCEIFIATIYDPTDGIGDIANAGLPAWPDGHAILTEYNRRIRAVAERHAIVHVVDVHAAFLGHGIHCRQFWRGFHHPEDPYYWYYDNLEDPNHRGYDAIRRLFLLEIARVLGPK